MSKSRRQIISLIAALILLLAVPASIVIWQVSNSLRRNSYLDDLSLQTALASNGLTVIAAYDEVYTAVWGENIGRLGDALSWGVRSVRRPLQLEEALLVLEFPTGATYTIYPSRARAREREELIDIHYSYKDTSLWMRSDAAHTDTIAALLTTVSPDGYQHPNLLLPGAPGEELQEQDVARRIEEAYPETLQEHIRAVAADAMSLTAEYEGSYTAVWGDNIMRISEALSWNTAVSRKPDRLPTEHVLTLSSPTGAVYTIYPLDYSSDNSNNAALMRIHFEYGDNSIWAESNSSIQANFRVLNQAASAAGYAHPNLVLAGEPAEYLSEAEIVPLLPADDPY